MSDDKRQLNPLLLLITILLCLSAGFLFHRTSFDPNHKIPTRQSASVKKTKNTPTPSAAKKKETDDSKSSTDLNPTATPTEVPIQKDASPEASKGSWRANGSNWMFLVDGTPYTGWLIDTDGKHYFFDKNGIMQTGWVDDGGKRYYMDLDGIMQTGTITVDDKSYELSADGSLKKSQPPA